MNDSRTQPDCRGYLVQANRDLLLEIVRGNAEGPTVPDTAAEARERRIANRRLEKFLRTE
jgi:hypothetical protein